MDMNNLPDDIIFYTNEQFYKLIENCIGVDEMKLLQIQSIRSSRTLLKVPDIFSIFSINCKETVSLKNSLCFIDDDNQAMVIKAGVKADFDDLISILREKNSKYLKTTKKSKRVFSTTSSSFSNTITSDTTTSQTAYSPIALTPATTVDLMPMNVYIQVIIDSIERFLYNSFENISLNHGDDYHIDLNQSNSSMVGAIKCGCKSIIKLPFRSHNQTFQLSSYFKHLKSRRCLLMKKKRQDLKQIHYLSNNNNRTHTSSTIEEDISSDEETNNLNQTTTDQLFSTDIYHLRKKRQTSLPLNNPTTEKMS